MKASQTIDFKRDVVDMTHGSGGQAMAQLIEQLFVAAFANDMLARRDDFAPFSTDGATMVMATDSHVISPLFFPGGDIGSLAVHGTVNDVAMSGAEPLYLACSFILEQGFPLADLQRIVHSMAAAARQAGVKIVTGDTKVVERGKGDGVFITTTGVGRVPAGIELSASRVQAGDAILLSGSLGDHGIAVLSQRESLGFHTTLQSDSAALNGLVAEMVRACPSIHCLRDPTRGGLAAVLNEIAAQVQLGMQVDESAIPLKDPVRAACELLGLDPLQLANEGKLVAFCPASQTEPLLAVMRRHPLGREAAIIGRVVAQQRPLVELQTRFGGRRILDWPAGEQLPRIC